MKHSLFVLLLFTHVSVLAGGDPVPSRPATVKLSPRQPVAQPVAASELPAWRTLHFHEEAFWATASSELTLSACGSEQELWCLQAISSVASNRENIELTAAPNGRLLDRKRSSQGSDQRRKSWNFGITSITRERQEPDASGEWRLTSSRKLSYPAGDLPVTDPILLLILAEPDREPRSFVVNTDINFYRVTARDAGEDLVEVGARLDDKGQSREVDLVAIEARPIEPMTDNADFNLLGLTGEVIIAYDRATGIPVQVRGKAPRIGMAELTARTVELRNPAP
jgi:hypothetical protein